MADQPPIQPERHGLERSEQLLHDSAALIPGGSHTNSKGPDQWVQGVAPTHMNSGNGCHVWDVDGNEYIDYPMARGPVTLGHDYPPVTEAVTHQLHDGVTFSTPHQLHVEVAKQLTDLIPCAEMVRFAKNGNDVTAAAAKLARAHTGRDVIATQGYHGWPDVWSAPTARNSGIPDAVGDYTRSFEYNDIESLERIFETHPDDVAAIVTTPVNYTPPEDDFLERVREIADHEDALLIFDEIITGFRFAVGGAQEYFGVIPDVACFAKGIANGFPLSALVGREDVMRTMTDEDFVFSLTYGGEAISLAAANATLDVLQTESVIDHLFEQGEQLITGYEQLISELDMEEYTACQGYPPWSQITFNPTEAADARLQKSLFMQGCLKRGVLFAGVQFLTYSHTVADVEYTLDVYRDALTILRTAIEDGTVEARLEGPPVGASLPDHLDHN